jgi:hypothetical protein
LSLPILEPGASANDGSNTNYKEQCQIIARDKKASGALPFSKPEMVRLEKSNMAKDHDNDEDNGGSFCWLPLLLMLLLPLRPKCPSFSAYGGVLAVD